MRAVGRPRGQRAAAASAAAAATSVVRALSLSFGLILFVVVPEVVLAQEPRYIPPNQKQEFPKNADLTSSEGQEDMMVYAADTANASAGLALAIGVVFIFCMCCGCIFGCCRSSGKKYNGPKEQQESQDPVQGASLTRTGSFQALYSSVAQSMHSVEPRDRKWFYIASLFCCLLYFVPALVVMDQVNSVESEVISVVDNTGVFLDDLGGMLCAPEERSPCLNSSVGGFLETVLDNVGTVFDTARAEAGEMRDGEGYANNSLDAARAFFPVAEELRDQARQYVDAYTAFFALYDGLTQSEKNRIAGIDNIVDIQANGLWQDFRALVRERNDSFEALYVSRGVFSEISSPNATVDGLITTLNTSEESVDDLLAQLLDSVEDTADSLWDMRDANDINGDTVSDALDSAAENTVIGATLGFDFAMLVALLLVLPCFVQLPTTLCAMCKCCKCRTPLCCSMACNICFTFFLIIFPVLFLAIGTITKDVCIHSMDLAAAAQGNETFSFGDDAAGDPVRVSASGALLDLVDCRDDENIVSLLGVESQFNISDRVDDVFGQITSIDNVTAPAVDPLENTTSMAAVRMDDIEALTPVGTVTQATAASIAATNLTAEAFLLGNLTVMNESTAVINDLVSNLSLAWNWLEGNNSLQIDAYNLDPIEDDLDTLTRTVAQDGPESTECSFVSKYIDAVMLGDCPDMADNVYQIGAFMFITEALLFISFCVNCCFLPRFKDTDEERKEKPKIASVVPETSAMPVTSFSMPHDNGTALGGGEGDGHVAHL